MLPGGREYTKQFSPSRRHMRASEERQNVCVCCHRNMRPSIHLPVDDEKKKNGRLRARATLRHEMEEGADTVDDDADELVDDDAEELVPIPGRFCRSAKGPVRHYAHEVCIHKMLTTKDSIRCPRCPRCQHAERSMKFTLPAGQGTTFCTHISGGFTGSSKLNAVLNWYKTVPEGDKVCVLCLSTGTRRSSSRFSL